MPGPRGRGEAGHVVAGLALVAALVLMITALVQVLMEGGP